MTFYNIMRYSARLTVGRHGFEAVTLDLAEDFPRYKEILARHGIPISRRLVIRELKEIQESGYNPETIKRVLEARQPGCSRGERNTPQCQLNSSLAQLELILDQMGAWGIKKFSKKEHPALFMDGCRYRRWRSPQTLILQHLGIVGSALLEDISKGQRFPNWTAQFQFPI